MMAFVSQLLRVLNETASFRGTQWQLVLKVAYLLFLLLWQLQQMPPFKGEMSLDPPAVLGI